MKHSKWILLCIASIFFSSYANFNHSVKSFVKANEEPCIDKLSLAQAINYTNQSLDVDSLFISDVDLTISNFSLENIAIESHLVLINDLPLEDDIFSRNLTFDVNAAGHLELKGFDLSKLQTKIINYGAVSLQDCRFREGRDLTQYIHNKGAFNIHHGVFIGDASGPIIRDASFKTGSYIIL